MAMRRETGVQGDLVRDTGGDAALAGARALQPGDAHGGRGGRQCDRFRHSNRRHAGFRPDRRRRRRTRRARCQRRRPELGLKTGLLQRAIVAQSERRSEILRR